MTDERPQRLPKGIERHGNGYRGAYYDTEGLRHKTPTRPRIEDALADLRRAWAAVERGEHTPPERRRITLDQWWQRWAPTRSVRPKTAVDDANLYRLHIKPKLGSLRLNEITPHRVQTWMRWMEDNGRSASLRARALTLLRTMLGPRGAIADRRLSVNPCDGIAKPRVDAARWEIPTAAEVRAIIEAAPVEWRPLLTVAAYTGLRWSELLGLQRQDYNALRCELHVRRGVTYTPTTGHVTAAPKSGRTRVIPLTPMVVAALNTQVAGKEPTEHLFTVAQRRGSGHLDHSNFMRNVWRPACVAAGVSYRFHDLRHFTASTLVASGVDLATVMEIMGHANLSTTQRYLHVSQERKRDAMLAAFS